MSILLAKRRNLMSRKEAFRRVGAKVREERF
jgi:hypothetical protein